MHPMNRLGKPEEVANAICWLLPDEAAFVTGHILSVDGGFQAKENVRYYNLKEAAPPFGCKSCADGGP